MGKGENQEVSPSPRINRPHGRPRKHEVDQAVPPTGEQRLEITRTGLFEDRRRVKCDDVDPTHLLRQHHDEGRQRGPSHPGNGEKFDEAGDVIPIADDVGFFHDLSMDIVEIPSRLERSISKPAKRFICVGVPTLLDIPSR